MSSDAVIGPPTGSRRLVRKSLLNLAGEALPLLAAVVAIPPLIERLGVERFGVLTLAWIVVGYLGFFDLGLGRAATKLVAERVGTEREPEIPSMAWTALLCSLALGVVAGGVLALASSSLVGVLHLSGALREEARTAFLMLAASLPLTVTLPALRGLLEANQRFGLVNAVRAPLGVSNFFGPLVAAAVSPDLVPVVTVLIATRALAWVAYLGLCLRVVPGLRRRPSMAAAPLGELLGLGGWLTASSVVGPLMLTIDRFVIGAMFSVATVAYYTTPYDTVVKLLVIPTALAGVLFPAFAASPHRPEATVPLYARGLRYVLIGLFPPVLVLIASAGWLLDLWLGPSFAAEGEGALKLLAAGMLVNGLAMVPFALLQARGRADLTAKVHLLEAPVYLVALLLLLAWLGIAGAALAWLLRAAIDAAILFVLAWKLLLGSVPELRPVAHFAAPAAASLGVASATTMPFSGLFTLPALIVFAAAAWAYLLCDDERAALARPLEPLWRRLGPRARREPA